MNFFTFDQAINEYIAGNWDPGNATYYVHLVKTAPTSGMTTVNQLNLPGDEGYTRAAVVNPTFVDSVLDFNPVLFNRYNGEEEVIGVVLVRQLGGSPSSSDRLISYSRLRNVLNAPLTIIPKFSERVRVDFPNGAIQFQNVFAYASGSWTGAWPINDGILYLLGTENGTSAFNPARTLRQDNTGNPKILGISDGRVGGSAGFRNFNNLNRNSPSSLSAVFLNSSDESQSFVMDFRSKKIRVGNIRFAGESTRTAAIRVDGTNELPLFNIDNANLNNNWTLLQSFTSSTYTTGMWYQLAVNSTQYYRYLRIKATSGAFDISEFDFFNSSIISPTANLTGV